GGHGRTGICPDVCLLWRAYCCLTHHVTDAARTGGTLHHLAGDLTGCRCLVLFAGWHVYWCDAGNRDAQQHGGCRGRFWADAAHGSVSGQSWFMAGARGLSLTAGTFAGSYLAPPLAK